MSLDVIQSLRTDYISYSPFTMLHVTTMIDLLKMLLQYGADTDEGKITPLLVATESNSIHAAQVLIEHGTELQPNVR